MKTLKLSDRVPDDFAFIEVNHVFGDVGRKVGDPLEVPGDGQVAQHRVDGLRILPDVVFERLVVLTMYRVDFIVLGIFVCDIINI